jgi:hypothetical protein
MATIHIRESRRIVLPLEAAVDAVLQLDWEHGGWLAEAPMTEARVEAGESPRLVLCFKRADSLEPETREYSLPAVAAAIVHLCVKARIPLPRWQKRIAVVPEGFELILEGTVEISRHYGPLPEIRAVEARRAAQDTPEPTGSVEAA